MNLFSDNRDLQHHFRVAIPWERFVPLWEPGFADPQGPRSLDEARELYLECLTELGDFAAREVAPAAAEVDAEGVSFVDGAVRQPAALGRSIEGLKRLGVMAVCLPRELGGFNFPYTVASAILELLAQACTNTMTLFAFYQAPALLVKRFGTAEQIERWVRPLAAGDLSGAIAITEPEAGSDVGALGTRAALDDAGWRVSGRKQFITNGCGDVCLVLARSEPGSQGLAGLSLFIVPRQLEGRENYRVARPEKKFVIRASATCELHFDGARAELLGRRGDGFRQMLTFMNEARIAVGIQGLGLSQAALEAARSYAGGRVQMGQAIARHPMIADLLIDMQAEVAAVRALTYATSALQDRLTGLERAGSTAREVKVVQRAVRDRTPLVKWLGAERALWVARSAVQIHGGYGVVQDYAVERHYRNALILPIYEGTSQIQALMSLKDQLGWALERPWRLLLGHLRVAAPPDPLGDLLRELADEYNRGLRAAAQSSLGVRGAWQAWRSGGRALDLRRAGPALLHAERLVEMLAVTRAAEALLASAPADQPERRRLAGRYLERALPRVRMLGQIVKSSDRLALDADLGA